MKILITLLVLTVLGMCGCAMRTAIYPAPLRQQTASERTKDDDWHAEKSAQCCRSAARRNESAQVALREQLAKASGKPAAASNQ